MDPLLYLYFDGSVFLLNIELLHSNVILMASSKHSILGDVCSLWSKASLQAARLTLLSILGYIEITSHDTSKVPAGNGENLLLISVTLLRRAVISMSICGSFLAQRCKKYSVNNDKFSTTVPLPDVINLIGLFGL